MKITDIYKKKERLSISPFYLIKPILFYYNLATP